MQELIVQLITIARNIWRFRWYAMLVAWVVALGAWLYIFKMPDQYESSARVYVDSESMLKPLLRGIAVEASDIRDQLGVMTNQLLSRPNLEKIMRAVDLDINAKTLKDKEEIIISLEKSIKLKAIQTNLREPPNIYEISTTRPDAKQARDIAQALLTVFLETAIGESREESGVAQQFLEAQIKEYEAKLVSAENRLMEYKRKNMGVLPSQGVGIFQRLQSARNDLSQIELELLEATNKRDEIKRQLEGLKANSSSGSSSFPNQPLSPMDMRISTLQQRLDDLQMKYTSEHPAVRETQQTLEALLKEKEKEKKSLGNRDADLATSNPVFQQLKIALSEVEAQIAGLKVRRNAFQNRLTKLHQDVATLPEVEAELQRLDRDYEINKQHYNELVKRRESAKLTEYAGETGEEVKFRVIDPPRMPLNPVGPNRFLFSTAALLAAIGIGLGVGFVLSQIRPVFYDRRTIQEVVGLPVFGVVSRVWTPELLFKRRSQFAAFLIFGLILVVVYGGVLYLNLKGINAIQLITNKLA